MSSPADHVNSVDSTLPWAQANPQTRTLLVDTEEHTVHRVDDLVEAGLLLASLFGILALSIYTQRTTSAVTSDVSSVISFALHQISVVPVRIIENFVTLLIPLLVIGVVAWRRQWGMLLQVLAAGAAGVIAANAASFFARLIVSGSGLLAALVVDWQPHWSLPAVAISPSLAGVTALLRMAGERSRERYLPGAWVSLWIVLVLLIIQGRMTLVSALVTVLIGSIVGSLSRYGFGMPNRRGSDVELITGLLTLGVRPKQLVRIDADWARERVRANFIEVSAVGTAGIFRHARLEVTTAKAGLDVVGEIATARLRLGLVAQIPQYLQANRIYAVTDTDDRVYRLEVTDSDRLLLTRFSDWWSRLRLRGTEHSEASTIRDAVEHTALVTQAAEAAGVRGAHCVGVTRADTSYAALFAVDGEVTSLNEVDPQLVTDAVIADLWEQLRICHSRGLTHRNIDSAAVALDADGKIQLSFWDQGEVAASDLTQRVDLVQALVLSCLFVGPEHGVHLARKSLGDDVTTSLLPVLQRLALPASTRKKAQAAKLLPQIRHHLQQVAQVESYDVPAVDLRGFSIKTFIIATVGVAVLVVIFSTLNFAELWGVLSQATWWWLIIGFGFSLLNAPAQTVILKGVCPEKLRWDDCTAVQLAGSLTSLVAPTGVGVAALNLRYLNRQGVATPLAIATVSLMQAFQFVVTVVLLLIFVGFTGTSIDVNFFSGPLLWSVLALVAAVGLFFAFTPTRNWAIAKLSGPISQIWPRLLWVIGSPQRVLLASTGVVLMVLTQVACFGCALIAFGDTLSFSSLAVAFLVSNTVGSLVPTPGGLGPVEASLTGGLRLAGISSAVALSAALTYRLLTFWGRAPVGWLALKYLQRRGIL